MKPFCFPGTFLTYSKECSRPSIGHWGDLAGSKMLSTWCSEQRQSCVSVAWKACFVLQPLLHAKSCHAWAQSLPSAGCAWPICWSGDHWSPIRKIGQSKYSRKKARMLHRQLMSACAWRHHCETGWDVKAMGLGRTPGYCFQYFFCISKGWWVMIAIA